MKNNNFSICQNKKVQQSDSSPPPLSSQHESSTIKDLHTSSTKFDFIFSIGKVPEKLQTQSREVTRHKDLAPNLSALEMSWYISTTQPLQPFCSWMQISCSDLYTCFLQAMLSPPFPSHPHLLHGGLSQTQTGNPAVQPATKPLSYLFASF